MSSPEQQRSRRRRLAESQGKAVRAYVKGSSEAAARERRLQRKREYRERLAKNERRSLLVRPRRSYDQHVKAYRKWLSVLHDAHVRRYLAVIKSRQKYALKYSASPEKERERVRNYKSKLPDAFVIEKLGLPKGVCKEILATLIELKREQLMVRRLSRQLKDAARIVNKEHYESLQRHT